MSFNFRFGLFTTLLFATFVAVAGAQQNDPTTQPPQTAPAQGAAQPPQATPADQTPPSPQTPSSQQTSPPQQAAPSTQPVRPQQQPPPVEPRIIEDGGLSLQAIYWLNRAQPDLRGGATATEFGGLNYPGNANSAIGGELSMPAGRSNSLRFSYFRVQGNANTTATQATGLFSEGYNAGDYLTADYLIQDGKLSWDYLSYTWYKHSGKIRLKTLYEVQLVNVGTNVDAPFKPVVTDSSGNTDYNTAHGTKNIIDPTFGLELEQAIGHHFRWEVKGSGFGLPQRADIWDAEASIAIRMRQVEIIGGEKAFHFKTSPRGDEYFTDTLSGAYVGLRYYWGRRQ